MPRQVQTPVYDAQPAAPGGSFQLNMPGNSPAKPPKKKKVGITILVVCCVVVVLLAAILAAVFSGVFTSPEAKLLKLEQNTLDAISKAVAEGYGDYVDGMKEQQKTAEEKGQGSKSTVKLSVEESALTAMLSGMTGGNLDDTDLSWIQSIMLQIEGNTKGENSRAEIGIGLNDTVLATLDVLMDMADGTIVAGIPEISDTYISMDMEEMGMSLDTYRAMMDLNAEMVEGLPAEKDVQEMLDSYLAVLLTYVDEVEKTKEEVTVGGETKELTVLSAKITEQQWIQMGIEWLKLAKEDETLKSLMISVLEYVNQVQKLSYGYETDSAEELYSEFLQEIEYGLEELEAELENADPTNYILLDNFVYHNTIIGRRATVYSYDEADVSAHYMILPVGLGANFELVWPDGSVTGSLNGEKLEAALNVEGECVLTVIADELKYEKNMLECTLRLIPGQALLDELSYYGVTADGDTYVDLTVAAGEKSGTVGVGLTLGGTELVGLEISFAQTEYKEAVKPSSTISTYSESDLTNWVMGFEFDTLISNMNTAGVPAEYVQIVEQLAALLKLQGAF